MRLGDIIEIKKGKKPATVVSEQKPGYQRLIQIDDLRPNAERKFCPSAAGEVAAIETDVIIAWDGANAATSSFGLTGVIGSTLAILRPIRAKMFTPYFGHFLQSNSRHLRERCKGATVPHIDGRVLEDLEIPLPPLAEQRRIADVLDRAEALRAKRRAALAQLDSLTQSLFLDLFGDPATNPKGFPLRSLSELYINKRDGTKCGPFGSALKKSELVDSGVPVWNMDNIDPSGRMALPFRMWITPAKYRQLEAYAVFDGDVIISRAGTVGKMCVANSGEAASIISTNLIRVRFGPDLLPIYFVSLMNYCKGSVGRLKTGPDGAFTHMNTGVLDQLKFPYPTLDLQCEFARRVTAVEALKTAQRASLAELDALFSTFQHRAFRGELFA